MTIDVQGAAQEFAQELQDLLDGVLPRPEGASSEERRVQVPFTGGRYAIRVGTEKTKIAVMKNGVLVAAVRVSYQCTADSAQTYLAVHKSSYELYETSDRLPIVRLEYEREAHTKPAAHWHVHGERGTLSRLLGRTNPGHPGVLSAVHLPVGGTRMRPCLEDFLQFLINEFRIDTLPDAFGVLADGRERWRRRQIAALVRDAPDEAVRLLTEIGYDVTPPESGERKPNTTALQRW